MLCDSYQRTVRTLHITVWTGRSKRGKKAHARRIGYWPAIVCYRCVVCVMTVKRFKGENILAVDIIFVSTHTECMLWKVFVCVCVCVVFCCYFAFFNGICLMFMVILGLHKNCTITTLSTYSLKKRTTMDKLSTLEWKKKRSTLSSIRTHTETTRYWSADIDFLPKCITNQAYFIALCPLSEAAAFVFKCTINALFVWQIFDHIFSCSRSFEMAY